MGGGHGIDHGGLGIRRQGGGGRGHMVDLCWFAFLGFLLLGPGLKSTLSIMTLAVTIPADFGEGAGLHMAWGGGGAVARAATTG